MKRKKNPIIDAIHSGFDGQHYTAIFFGDPRKLPKETQLDDTRNCFTSETISEVGALVLWAILAGDRRMIGTVRDAIKAGDHLFNRDRELALLKRALRYRLVNWDAILHKNGGNSQRSVEELKAGIEAHCNGSKELDQYRWTRLRRALGLPKRSCVRHDRNPVKLGEVGEIIDLAPSRRPRTSSTKRRKTVS